jgi:hypothetical protein
LFPDDDLCLESAPPEVVGLSVRRSGADLFLTWDVGVLGDPCADYDVLSATAAPPDGSGDFTLLASGLSGSVLTHTGGALDGVRVRSYLVRASSWFSGPGPLGHYGE